MIVLKGKGQVANLGQGLEIFLFLCVIYYNCLSGMFTEPVLRSYYKKAGRCYKRPSCLIRRPPTDCEEPECRTANRIVSSLWTYAGTCTVLTEAEIMGSAYCLNQCSPENRWTPHCPFGPVTRYPNIWDCACINAALTKLTSCYIITDILIFIQPFIILKCCTA